MLKFGNTFVNFGGAYLTDYIGEPSWVELSNLSPNNTYLTAGTTWKYDSKARYRYEAPYYGDPKTAPYQGKCTIFNTPEIKVPNFPAKPSPECTNYTGLIQTNNLYKNPPTYVLSRLTLYGHSVYGWDTLYPATPWKTTAYFEMNFPTNDKVKVNLLNGDMNSKYVIPTQYEPASAKKITLLKNPYQFFINDEEKKVDGLSSKMIQTYTTGNFGTLTGCTLGQPFTVAMLRKVSDGSYSAYLCENSGTELSLFATGTNNVGYPLSAQGNTTNYSGNINLYHGTFTDTRYNEVHWGNQAFFVMNMSQSACYNSRELRLEDFNDMAIYQETRN